jgi:hypothetical protein
MSKIKRHIRGWKKFRGCVKMDDRDVPAYSNMPLSLDTLKVISVVLVGIPRCLRKAIKFAGHNVSPGKSKSALHRLTICCIVENDEAGVDIDMLATLAFEYGCIRLCPSLGAASYRWTS